MTEVFLATGNAHKVGEVVDALRGRFAVVARDPQVDETGETFEENALLKARALAVQTGSLALGDDSGIEVDHLDRRPGIHSARWTEESDWIPRVLRELDGVASDARTCRYVCAAAAVWPDGREVVVRGTCEGRIADGPSGTNGFGYDPIVIPDDGDGRTFGEMTAEEKLAVSHRSRAFAALAEYL